MRKESNKTVAVFSSCLCLLMTGITLALIPVSQRTEYCTLPVQAYLCDLAGVGVVIESEPTWFNIAISNVWFGTATGNVMRIEVIDCAPPVTNAPIVFLASTNLFFKADIIDPIRSICSLSFLTNRTVHSSYENNYTNAFAGWNLIGDKLSWFYTSDENGSTLIYASNLVYKACVQKNHESVYEYLRSQADTNAAPTRKIWLDARLTFVNWAWSGPNAFRHKMEDDPLMPIYIKHIGRRFMEDE